MQSLVTTRQSSCLTVRGVLLVALPTLSWSLLEEGEAVKSPTVWGGYMEPHCVGRLHGAPLCGAICMAGRGGSVWYGTLCEAPLCDGGRRSLYGAPLYRGARTPYVAPLYGSGGGGDSLCGSPLHVGLLYSWGKVDTRESITFQTVIIAV